MRTMGFFLEPGRVSRGIDARTSYRVLSINFCLHVSMVVVKSLSGFTSTAILGLGLYRMETCGEKSVILSTSHGSATNVGSFKELHVNGMATACVVDNVAALFCLMTMMQCCAAVGFAQTFH